jgi:lipopolysaccharide export system permease protein
MVVTYYMKLTLHKYVFNEIWPNFLASLLVAVFIIIATRMMSIAELIVNRGAGVGQVFGMVLFLLPDVVTFALPAATLMAVVVAFLRLSSDSEIIALKSCGISLYQMLPSVALISFLAFFMALTTGILGVPWGNKSFKDLVFQMAEAQGDLGIKERVFSEPFDEVVFYVNGFSERDRVMTDVFVVDSRDHQVTNTIVAQEGKIVLNPEQKSIIIRFLDGSMFVVDKDLRSARTITFKTYDLNIELKDIMAALAARQKKPKEMGVRELMTESGNPDMGETKRNIVIIELLEKFTIPLAVFLMGIIGMPLGAQIRGRGRSAGVGVSLVVFLIYYLCLGGVRNVSETGMISPYLGVWIPVLFLSVSCIYLFRLVGRERPIQIMPSFLSRERDL